jgi:isohexenylglutaconyl-CoA hydratase
MKLPDCTTLKLEFDAGVLRLALNRPEKRNAMNLAMVEEIAAVFEAASADRLVRAVVIRGEGGHFCAGGDISGMDIDDLDEEQAAAATWRFNRVFGHMITRVNHAPQVVITLLEGAVLGGGLGLACVSDVAIADSGAKFSMPETGLGIIPAQIAPFVVKRIGLTQARRMALLGERLDGAAATEMGISHYLTHSSEEMDSLLKDVLAKVRRCAPGANAMTKKLMLQVDTVELEALLDHAADLFTESIRKGEGKEGTRAFLEKRQPAWALEPGNKDRR